MKKRALVVLAEGFEDVEAVAPIDVLNRVGVEVVVASLEPGPVPAAYGITIVPDMTLGQVCGEFDAIICPGGKKNAEVLAQDVSLRELIREYYTQGKLVAAICAAPSHVFGESAQILKGKRATGDPGFNEKLRESGAQVTEERVTRDANIITGEGPGAALEFSLAVASYLVGPDAVKAFAEKWGVELKL